MKGVHLSPNDSITVVQPRINIGDPHICSDSKSRLSMLFSLYEALVDRDSEGVFSPSLAESWAVDDDVLSWVFRLRDGVQFHNGERLRARDVVASLDRVRDPSLGGELGTEGVYASYIGDAVIDALDERTVRIATSKPMADLLDLVVAFPIAPESALDELPENHVGTGPYRLVESDGSEVVHEVFRDYWGAAPRVKRVRWVLGRSSDEMARMLVSGEADIAPGLSRDEAESVRSSGNAGYVSRHGSMCMIFMYNCSSGPCVDRRVRQALNYALDKREIIERLLPDAAEPLKGVLTPLHVGYDPSVPGYPYDPEKAMRLMAEADHKGGLSLLVNKPGGNAYRTQELIEVVGEMYSKVGVTVEVDSYDGLEPGGYSDKVRSKDIGDMCWFDSSPLSTFRVMREKLHSGLRGPWWEGYENPGVDRLIEEAAATVDLRDRKGIYERIYRMTSLDPPWVFLYRPMYFWGVGPSLRGWAPGVDGLILPACM
jgi:peptide/nickel transport system substrate-binding protein